MCRVNAEGAEMVFASDLRRVSWCGACGDAGHRYRARLPALGISAGGILVGIFGVPLEEGFDAH